MHEFFPEIEINESQAHAIARGLFAIARADGELHDREAGLITEFFATIAESPADLGSLQRQEDISPEHLAAALVPPQVRRLFVKTSLLLAYADGTFGDGESKAIRSYAAALEVSEVEIADLTQRVKEFLLAQLSHLANVDAAAEVAKELDV